MDEIKVVLGRKEVVCPKGHVMWNKSKVREERDECLKFPGTYWTTEVKCEECQSVYRVNLHYANSYH